MVCMVKLMFWHENYKNKLQIIGFDPNELNKIAWNVLRKLRHTTSLVGLDAMAHASLGPIWPVCCGTVPLHQAKIGLCATVQCRGTRLRAGYVAITFLKLFFGTFQTCRDFWILNNIKCD